ncbi:MAG: DUF1499 domain-containing protein [Pseudomonadota bacterium]
MTTFLALIAFGGVLLLLLKVYGFEKVWERTNGPADLGLVVFETLKKGPKPNQALICPQNMCSAEDRDSVSPRYALSADAMKKAFIKSLEGETHLHRVDDDSDPMQIRYVQHTPLLRFPDTISVRFIPLDENRSTIALYARAQVGYSDMGNNLKRLNRWLSRLTSFETSYETS